LCQSLNMVRAVPCYYASSASSPPLKSPPHQKKKQRTAFRMMASLPSSTVVSQRHHLQPEYYDWLPSSSTAPQSSSSYPRSQHHQQHGGSFSSSPTISFSFSSSSFPPPPPQQGPKTASHNRRVRFADPETTRIAYTDWNLQDTRNSWYQVPDYTSFEQDSRLTVLALRHVRGDLRRLDPQQYTVMGLEKNLSRKQMLHRKLQTARHVQTVIEQQYFYCNDNTSNAAASAERLKAVSELFSQKPIKRAHLRGVLDQTLLSC